MRWSVALLALIAASAALPPTASAAVTPKEVARTLERDPVYVEPNVRSLLTRRDERRLERHIARQADGRVAIALLSERSVRRGGGIERFLATVDGPLKRPGTLLVTAGSQTQLATTYGDTAAAVAAAQRGFDAKQRRGIPAQLTEVVDRVRAVDPGPSADLDERPAAAPPAPAPGNGTPVTTPDVSTPFGAFLEDVADAIRTGIFTVVGLLALVIGLAVGARWRRAHKRERIVRERLERELEVARAEHAAIGEGIRELDLEHSLQEDTAPPAARSALVRAIEAYDRVNRELPAADELHELESARAALREGRSAIEEARALLGGGSDRTAS